ncbi:MAG: FadR/GntR family transcriptional regulator [Proteobacteria bacterium]|nr:FadR/GntR family transcriptional regulator [Pseudomonadota bacterium]
MNKRERSHELSGAVRASITDRIASGELAPGDRVPTERALSEKYEIARNTVRTVLRQLERDGLIVRHVGSGTFVADREGQGRVAPATGIGDASPSDIMEVRLLVEPGMGELAVLRATQSDLDTLQKCLERGEAARSWREFERWDAEFHEALALTTKNRAVIDILSSINRLRSLSAWGELKKKSLTPARRTIYERQHRAILTALSKRDSAGAQKTIRQHLLSVRHNLIGY